MALIPRMLPAGISSCSLPLQTTTRVSRKTMLLPSKLTALLLFLLIDLQLLALIIKPIDLLPIAFAVPLAVVSRLISAAWSHAREPAQQGTRYRGADLGGIARRNLDRARFDAARLAVAGRTPGRHLRRRHLHDRRARPDYAALRAPRLRGEEPNLDRLRSKQPRVLGFAAWSRDRREMPRCRSRRAASPARVRPSRPRFLLARKDALAAGLAERNMACGRSSKNFVPRSPVKATRRR